MSTSTKSRDDIREAISQIDRQLIEAIARRSQLVEEILEAKAASGQPVRDRDREQAVLKAAVEQGKTLGVRLGYRLWTRGGLSEELTTAIAARREGG